jgi:methyl acetate hydrolase
MAQVRLEPKGAFHIESVLGSSKAEACVKRQTVLFSLALTIGAACAAVATRSWADAPSRPPPKAASALSQVLTQAVDRQDAPGVVGLVVDRKGVLFEGAAGKADVARNVALAPDAIFFIASMTKPVTSVAIMMLIEQGKLSLDDPVSKYLPGFDNLQVITKFNEADGTYETRPARRTMTLCHLLTHTSGIGYAFSSPILARLSKDNHKDEWEFPLLHEPGQHWTYGASTRVLGLIVEKVTGESLEAYDQKHILGPLGMVDTSYAVPKDKQSRVVKVYRHIDGAFQEQSFPVVPDKPTPPFRGDGGLYSTAQDYGRFMRMLLNGGRLGNVRILSEKTLHLMEENQIGPVFVSLQPVGQPDSTRPFPLGAGHDKFGLGFQIASDGPDAAKYRRAGSLSWAGIFNTEFWVDPHSGIGGVLLMQYLPFYDESAIRTLRDFEAAVYQDLVLH